MLSSLMLSQLTYIRSKILHVLFKTTQGWNNEGKLEKRLEFENLK